MLGAMRKRKRAILVVLVATAVVGLAALAAWWSSRPRPHIDLAAYTRIFAGVKEPGSMTQAEVEAILGAPRRRCDGQALAGPPPLTS